MKLIFDDVLNKIMKNNDIWFYFYRKSAEKKNQKALYKKKIYSQLRKNYLVNKLLATKQVSLLTIS